MTCYKPNEVQPGDVLSFKYNGGTHPHKLRTLLVEDKKDGRIYCKEDGVLKCFLLNKISQGWFDVKQRVIPKAAHKADFSVNLNTVLNLLSITHPVHTVDFDGNRFNFYRKN